MLTISKPLSSGQAQSYHKLEFTAETQNYYKQGGAIQGEWQGQLAASLGLSGEVSPRICAALRRQAPPNRGADGPAAGGTGVQECGRKDDQGG